MKRAFAAAMVATVCLVRPAFCHAHFIWIAVEEGKANLYFSEDAAPGAALLLDKISHAELFALRGLNQAEKLALSKQITGDAGRLVAELGETSAKSLAARCRYGVYKKHLLHYYSRYEALDEERKQGRPAKQLHLDIVPHLRQGKLELEFLRNGKPCDGAAVEVRDPQGKRLEPKLTAGKCVLKGLTKGRYLVRASYVEDAAGGRIDGQDYESTMHQSTLVLDLEQNASAEVSATELLRRARKSRAVWRNFPGMKAKVVVNVDGAEFTGNVTISSGGEMTHTLEDSTASRWVERRLASLVQHRMPSGDFAVEASYEDDVALHPLGRRMRLAEDLMGSIYRVRENVVTQVNRRSKAARFTISVLDVHQNPEGKYLPAVFTVTFWNPETGDVLFSQTHKHTWRRLGKFDVPLQLIEVHSGKDEYHVRTMEFVEPRLAR